MLLNTRGKALQIDDVIIAPITRIVEKSKDKILIKEGIINDLYSYSCKVLLTNAKSTNKYSATPLVYAVPAFDHLSEGDIVMITSSGIIQTLYRVNSYQNFLLVTERCNSNCLMCSQPPKNKNDIPFLFQVFNELIPLIPKNCFELGITGGEPTLMGEYYFKLLKLIKTELPYTELHCLTNGRSFGWRNVAKKLSDLNLNQLMLGIPLYADYYQLHDYIVQAKNAFYQTMRGLYNLASYGQRIEIRVVLHKLSIPRLVKLSRYIYKNLPFAEHIAFMGLEYQGYTPYNIQRLWIDPVEYMDELSEAVLFLADKGMNVSIYNSQLCLMPESLWPFSKNSISDWKNMYLNECSSCKLINDCGGLFTSSKNMHSAHIKPFA